MLRVTADVNTLVEGTISRAGPAGAILAEWEAGHVVLLTCEPILAEYREVLGRPLILRRCARITPETIAASAATLHDYGICVTLTDVPRVVTDDPDDDVVLACAVSGGADYIVSRDEHLLRLGNYQGIPIVPPQALVPILRARLKEEQEPPSTDAPERNLV